MDFVVGGVGLGALAVLLGIVLRNGGAWWTRGRRSRGGREYAAALDAVCRASGRRLVLGGGLLVLLTVLALVAGASDGIGAAVVGVATAATAAGLAAWFAQARRHHLRPLAAWPAHPDADAALDLASAQTPDPDGPPRLADAIDRGLTEGGTVAVAVAAPPEPNGDAAPLPAEEGQDGAGGPRWMEAAATVGTAEGETPPLAPPSGPAAVAAALALDAPLPAPSDPDPVPAGHDEAPTPAGAALAAPDPAPAADPNGIDGDDAAASAVGDRFRQRVEMS